MIRLNEVYLRESLIYDVLQDNLDPQDEDDQEDVISVLVAALKNVNALPSQDELSKEIQGWCIDGGVKISPAVIRWCDVKAKWALEGAKR